MSEQLINSLNTQIERLTKELAEVRAESAQRRKANQSIKAELEQARKDGETVKAELANLTADRDTWKGKAEAAPGEQAKRIKELERAVLVRDHKDAFRSTLNGKLHEKASLEEVWAAIGYEPGDKIPTADELKGLVGKAQEAKPYLFQAEAQAANGKAQGGQGPAPLNGAGGGRGNPDLGQTPKSIAAQFAELWGTGQK